MAARSGMKLHKQLDHRKKNPLIRSCIAEVHKKSTRTKQKSESTTDAYKRKLTAMKDARGKKRKKQSMRFDRMVTKVENERK